MKNRLPLLMAISMCLLQAFDLCADAFSRFVAAKTPQARLVELAQLYAEAISSRVVQTKIAKSREFTGNKKNLKGIRASILNKIKSETTALAKRSGGVAPAELERLERERQAALRRATEVGRSLGGVESERDTLASQLQAAQKASAAANKRVADLERQLRDAAAAASGADTRADDLARQLAAAQAAVAAATARATAAEAQVTDLQSQLAQARDEAARAATDAVARIRELDGLLQQARAQADGFADRIRALEGQLATANADNARLQRELADANAARDVAQAEVQRLTDALAIAQGEARAANERANALQQQVNTLQAENTRLQQELAAAQRALDGLRADVARLTTENARLQADQDTLVDEITRLENDLAVAREENNRLRGRVTQLEAELAELRRQMTTCGSGGDPAKIAAELLRLRQRVKDLEDELADLRAHAGDLEAALARLNAEDKARLEQLRAVFGGDLQEAIRLLVKEPLKILSYMEHFSPNTRSGGSALGGVLLVEQPTGNQKDFFDHLLYIQRGSNFNLGIGSDWYAELAAKSSPVAGNPASDKLAAAKRLLNERVRLTATARGMSEWNNLCEILRGPNGLITLARSFIPRRMLMGALSNRENDWLRHVNVPDELKARWREEDAAQAAPA